MNSSNALCKMSGLKGRGYICLCVLLYYLQHFV